MLFRKALKQMRYPIENDKAVIELKVSTIHQLFDERDPAPFRDKDLDDDAAEYIFVSAQEISADRIARLRIFVEEALTEKQLQTIRYAVNTFYSYESDLMSKRITALISIAFKSLLIGISFMTASIIGSHFVSLKSESFVGLFFKESIVLVGWVSMWRPVSLLLYEWWPLVDTLNIYRKLSELEVDVVSVCGRVEERSH